LSIVFKNSLRKFSSNKNIDESTPHESMGFPTEIDQCAVEIEFASDKQKDKKLTVMP
jgi:hypothetical protein